MRIDEIILSLDIEELRKELCLSEYEPTKLIIKKIKEKFEKINNMMNEQIKVHKHWDFANAKEGEK